MKVKVAQLCPTLCHPMDCTVHGILQARILEWAAFLFSRGSSEPRDWTLVSWIAGGFFTSWATREARLKKEALLNSGLWNKDFLMWVIFSLFEFVTILFLFCVLVFWPHSMWDLNSSIRDQIYTSCFGGQSLNHLREVPRFFFFSSFTNQSRMDEWVHLLCAVIQGSSYLVSPHPLGHCFILHSWLEFADKSTSQLMRNGKKV